MEMEDWKGGRWDRLDDHERHELEKLWLEELVEEAKVRSISHTVTRHLWSRRCVLSHYQCVLFLRLWDLWHCGFSLYKGHELARVCHGYSYRLCSAEADGDSLGSIPEERKRCPIEERVGVWWERRNGKS